MWERLRVRLQGLTRRDDHSAEDDSGKVRLWPREWGSQPPVVTVRDGGFDVNAGRSGCESVAWSAITRVAAHKYDLFAVDEIVLAFETNDRRDVVIEVSEEWPGFADLFAPLTRELCVEAGWYNHVMFPVFATSYRVLFERQNLTPLVPDRMSV